jgi:hypothetical protein
MRQGPEQFRRASLTFTIQNEAQLGAPVLWAVAFGSAPRVSRQGHRAGGAIQARFAARAAQDWRGLPAGR